MPFSGLLLGFCFKPSPNSSTFGPCADPSLKVRYVTVSGSPLPTAEQNDYGLKLFTNLHRDDASAGEICSYGTSTLRQWHKGERMWEVADVLLRYCCAYLSCSSPVPFLPSCVQPRTAGVPISITVLGSVESLCPLPGLVPVMGHCEVVVQGSANGRADACCPATVSEKSAVPVQAPEQGYSCEAGMYTSPYQLAYDSFSAQPAMSSGQYISYHFRLKSIQDTCSGTCCDSQLSSIELKVLKGSVVKSVTLGGSNVKYMMSKWYEDNTESFRSLIIDNLNYVPEDLGGEGLMLTITTQAAVSSSGSVPDLCDPSATEPSGECFYVIDSADGQCCPSGLASGTWPSCPPDTCCPGRDVPLEETTMSLLYYQREETDSTTTFTFLVANHNGASCNKKYCVDVCSWSLMINPAVVSQLTIGHEDPRNSNMHNVDTKQSMLTFTYGPGGESTTTFFVTIPGRGKELSDVCASKALPGQSNSACGAILRSSSVFSPVFLDPPAVLGASPPPPGPHPTLCPVAKPMSDSCLAITKALYNTVPNTLYNFFATALSAAGCSAPGSPGTDVSVHVVLSAVAVDQLSTWKQVSFANGLQLDRSNGAVWTVPATENTTIIFQLPGSLSVNDVCRQDLLPDQPPGTCVAEVYGDMGCYRSYVKPLVSDSIVSLPTAPIPRKGVDVATVVPAVVIPIFILLLALIVLAVWYRRRRAQQYAYAGSVAGSADGADLNQPLAGRAGSAAGSLREDLSIPSASPSDVQIRVPGASQGGAGPMGRQ